MRLGIFGGTFNPIHLAHATVAREAFRQLSLDRLLLAPSAQPPHKVVDRLAPGEHRLHMAELVAAGEPGWEVSDVEIRRGGRSYTIDTVRTVVAEHGLRDKPFFLIGGDMLQDLATWRDVGQLVDLCLFAVVARPHTSLQPPPSLIEAIGADGARDICGRRVNAALMHISSTAVRARVARGEPIDDLVPKAVADYIAEHGLYR